MYQTPTHFLESDIDAKCPVDRFPPPAFSDCDPRNVFEDWRTRIEELMVESQDLLREARLISETLWNRIEQREGDREHGIRKQ